MSDSTRVKGLTQDHAEYLRDSGITDDVMRLAKVRSCIDPSSLPLSVPAWWKSRLPGILFPWVSGSKRTLQLRPDETQEGQPKYLFPVGSESIFNRLREPSDPTQPYLIVEGTKQHLCVASWAAPGAGVYGMSGCYGYTKEDLSVFADRDVYLIFDGDVSRNVDVWNAADTLREKLSIVGAASVRFILVPTTGTDGIDDFLAKLDPAIRHRTLANLLDKSSETLPKKPKPRRDNPFFGETGLLVDKLSKAVMGAAPMALTREGLIAVYSDGVYKIDAGAFSRVVGLLLKDDFRPTYRAAVEEYTVGLLSGGGRILPDRPTTALLNVRNGMLNLATGELQDHSPDYMSAVQLPIDWDEDAQCVHYEQWAKEVIPDQLDDLEESVSVMLDPSRTPTKAVFLYGPSRSGKSTYMRLLQSVVGPRFCSGVTLHQLSDSRFAAANVYGKILNMAADLSADHINDLSVFKMLTGGDLIQADRKWGQQFAFVNTALFVFSANRPPTVSETSRAYQERIRPFRFGQSFAGHEDQSKEDRIQGELPGILVRWVKAYRRFRDRGGYGPTDPAVLDDFVTRSDRVALWVSEACVVTPSVGVELPRDDMSTRRELSRAFAEWSDDSHTRAMGERRVIDRLLSLPGVKEVRSPKDDGRVRGLNIRVLTPEEVTERDRLREDDHVSEMSGGSFGGRLGAVSDGQSATHLTCENGGLGAEGAVPDDYSLPTGIFTPTTKTPTREVKEELPLPPPTGQSAGQMGGRMGFETAPNLPPILPPASHTDNRGDSVYKNRDKTNSSHEFVGCIQDDRKLVTVSSHFPLDEWAPGAPSLRCQWCDREMRVVLPGHWYACPMCDRESLRKAP